MLNNDKIIKDWILKKFHQLEFHYKTDLYYNPTVHESASKQVSLTSWIGMH